MIFTLFCYHFIVLSNVEQRTFGLSGFIKQVMFLNFGTEICCSIRFEPSIFYLCLTSYCITCVQLCARNSPKTTQQLQKILYGIFVSVSTQHHTQHNHTYLYMLNFKQQALCQKCCPNLNKYYEIRGKRQQSLYHCFHF